VLKKTNILKILKVLMSLTIIFVLYRQFDSKIADYNMAQNLPLLKQNYFYLFLLFILMFIQWFVEAQKWRFLLCKVQYLKFGQSIKAIFSGLSVSFLTPNRTGEFLGRIIFIPKVNRIKASIITFICNYSQLLTTITIGLVSLFYLPNYFNIDKHLDRNYYYIIIFFTLIISNILYFFTNKIYDFASIFSKKNKYLSQIEVFKIYSKKELLIAYLYSMFRYIIFIIQYYIAFLIFEVHISLIDFVILKPISILFVTAIPTVSITDAGVRVSSALAIFELVDISTNIISATILIWLVNLVIPSLIGLLFFNKLKSQA
jgi:hypothetical protein